MNPLRQTNRFLNLPGILFLILICFDLCPAQTDREHLLKGIDFAYEGIFDLAITEFNKAIKLNPRYSEAYTNRANVYYVQQKFVPALADYNKAIECDPRNDKAYTGRGNLYTKQKKYEPALADFSKAIELNPQNIEAYNNRGVVYDKQKKYEPALADYNRTIELNPEFSLVYANRGNFYAKQKKYDLAISDFNKWFELTATYSNPNYSLIRAWSYYNENDFTRAEERAAVSLQFEGIKGRNTAKMIIIGYLSVRKSGDKPRAEKFLDSWLKHLNQKDWETQILKYFKNQLTDKQLLALAVDSNKLRDAHTYIGEIKLLENNKPEALLHFNWVRDNGTIYYEYILAIHELKQLQ